ncbi:hypothetical protein R3W88_026055 [Solanum pinnatisectum]|uniref:Uncharacterized protein n=1 Tax=Solanum pinnatisectum TaxID=50273 RepID=A0AAV9LC40_9SOLN|nr:hypothetical protein R3W88_026055 [Solanum pinnatisectum]
MNTSDLVEVGTRGSIGSLLRKEIEYFRTLELECNWDSIESQNTNNYMKMDSSGCCCWHSFVSPTMKWKKKRRINECLPAMCSIEKEIIRFSDSEMDLGQVLWL